MSLVELDSDAELEALDQGQLDVAVIRHVAALERDHAIPLTQTVLGVLLGRDDPMAHRDHIPLSQLAGRALLLFPRHIAPACHEELVRRCRRAGFEPSSIHEAAAPEDFAEALGATLAERLATFSARPRDLSESSLIWRPLEGSPMTITTSAVMPQPVTSIAAHRFVEALIEEASAGAPSEAGAPGQLRAARRDSARSAL